MRNTPKYLIGACAVALMVGSLALTPQTARADFVSKGWMPTKSACKAASKDGSNVVKGGCIATARKGGNCMACHTFAGLDNTGLQPGNIGPPLVGMKARFPDRAKLTAQVSDPTKANPHTVMPPFGKNHILSKKEIDLVVDWLYTL